MSEQAALPAPPQKAWDDDFEQIDESGITYADAIPEREIKARKVRGRRGMDGLFELVSSKNARDVARKGDWMAPAPFRMWNDKDIKRNKGKQRFWGQFEDYDNDGLPIEFVVRRGKPDGPVVGVNGYTTKASDYPWRAEYYDAYPTKEARKETSFDKFMFDKYGPVYKDDNMTVDSWRIDPETDRRTVAIKKHGGYTYPVPKERSPYQAFTTILVYPVIDDIIFNDFAGKDEDKAKAIRKAIALNSGKGPGFASVLCSELYYTYVLHGIYELLKSNGLMSQYQSAYIEQKKRTNPRFTYNPSDPDDDEKFTAWLRSRKEFKEAAKARTAKFVNTSVVKNIRADIKAKIKPRLQMLLGAE